MRICILKKRVSNLELSGDDPTIIPKEFSMFKKMFFGSLLVLLLGSLAADVTYTYKSSAWSEKEKKPKVMTGTVYLKPASFFRMEFDSSDTPMMDKETFWISKDGKNITIVNKAQKTYETHDLDKMLGMLSSLMNAMGQMMQMTVENPSVTTVRGTKDEIIAGMKTRHYVVDSQYTLRVKMAFIKSVQVIKSTKEIWVTDSLSGGAIDILQKKNYKTGHVELDKLIEMETLKLKGDVVKMLTVTESKSEKGEVTKDYTEHLVTTVKQAPLQASLFQVPAGYSEVKQEEIPAKNQDAKGSQKEEGSEAEEGNPMDALKSLKGLLGQ